MEFFIPYVDDAEKAEGVWQAIERFLSETQRRPGAAIAQTRAEPPDA